jgi:hypothetical protein
MKKERDFRKKLLNKERGERVCERKQELHCGLVVAPAWSIFLFGYRPKKHKLSIVTSWKWGLDVAHISVKSILLGPSCRNSFWDIYLTDLIL